MPPPGNVFVGVCGWVERDKGLLMIRRGGKAGFSADGYGTWTCPGGWLEFGEQPEDAAVREVYEETGVTCKATERMGFVCNISQDRKFQIVTLFIRCEYLSGTPSLQEPDKSLDPGFVEFWKVEKLPLFAPVSTWLGQS